MEGGAIMGVIKDVGKVIAIVGTVVSALNLNDYQAKTLRDYAKAEANEWVAKRKDESEIESMLRSKGYEIKW